MKKHLFIYFTHRWNDDIRQRYAEVTESLKKCEDTDVLLMYADIIKEEIEKDPIVKEKKLMYRNADVEEHFQQTSTPYQVIDPFSCFKPVYRANKEYFNNYDDVYIWEYDQWYSGDLGEYISMLNKEEADLIGAYMAVLDNRSLWYHYHYYKWCIDNHFYEQQHDHVLKSCISFCRITLKYLDLMFSEKYDRMTKLFLYELYVPTIIYNDGGIIKSISTDGNEFDWRDDVRGEIFSCDVLFNKKEEMVAKQKNYDHPMLYTRWK